MSSSPFMPPAVPHSPAARAGLRTPVLTFAPARTSTPTRTSTPARDGAPAVTRPGRRAGRHPRAPVLALSSALEPGRAADLTDAVLARVSERGGATTVILDLGDTDDLDEWCCAALRGLHDRLHCLGTRFRLVAACEQVREQCAQQGLTDLLGSDALHRNLRTAVLAAYASLPGPGLVTTEVRAAMAAPAEPLPWTPAG